MVKQKSDPFWKHAVDLKGKFECNFCKHKFPGGITRVKSHLSGVRGRDIKICSKVSDDVKLEALEALNINASAIRNYETLASVSNLSKSGVNTDSNFAPNGDIMSSRDMDNNSVNRTLAKFIISNGLSPCVEIPYLSDLVSGIAGLGSGYKLPDFATIETKLVPDIKKEVENYIANAKKFLPTTGCTLMIYPLVHNYIKLVCVKIFAYTPAGLMYLFAIEIPQQGITFAHFMDLIFSAIEYLGPEHVVQFIFSDVMGLVERRIRNVIIEHGRNFYVLIQDTVQNKYPWIYWIPCATSQLEDIIILIFLDVPWVFKTADMARLIYSFLHKNETNSLILRSKNINNKVYHFGFGPFMRKISSDLFLLNSLLEEEETLQALQLVTIEGEGSSSVDHQVATVVDMALRSKDLWTRGRKVIQVLKPLFQALNLVDRYGSNMGYLYEAMNKVEDAIKQHCNINPCNKSEQVHLQTILNIIKKCWRECQVNNHPMHAAAAFLNPAFLWSKEFVEDSKMEQCLKFLKQLVIEEEEGEAFVKQLKLYRIKTPDLFTDAAVKFVNQVHPRKWWEIFGDGLPILKKYAVRVLSQPCASSICDSVWLPNSSNDELGMNMVAMENFNRMRPQEFDIIDLEKFSGLPGCDLQHIRRCLGQRQDPDDFDYYDLLVINDPPYLFRDQNPLPVDFQFHFVDFGFWR